MIIAELCNVTSYEKKYIIQQDLYDFLGKKYKKIYFINIRNIFNKKKVKINHWKITYRVESCNVRQVVLPVVLVELSY